MKKIFIKSIICAISLLTLCGCENKPNGKYISTTRPAYFRIFRDDGTCLIVEQKNFTCNYRVDGDVLTMQNPQYSQIFVTAFKNGKITDKDGEIFQKE